MESDINCGWVVCECGRNVIVIEKLIHFDMTHFIAHRSSHDLTYNFDFVNILFHKKTHPNKTGFSSLLALAGSSTDFLQ